MAVRPDPLTPGRALIIPLADLDAATPDELQAVLEAANFDELVWPEVVKQMVVDRNQVDRLVRHFQARNGSLLKIARFELGAPEVLMLIDAILYREAEDIRVFEDTLLDT